MFYTKIENKSIFFTEPGTGKERSIDYNIMNGKKFESDDEARQLAEYFEYDRAWIPLVLNYYINNPENPIDSDDIEQVRIAKYDELTEAFTKAITKTKTTVEDIGEVDAGTQYLINAMTLIDLSKATGGSIDFKMYDNTTKKLTTEQLEQVKLAIQMHGVKTYQKKWEYETKIVGAKTLLELKNLTIEF